MGKFVSWPAGQTDELCGMQHILHCHSKGDRRFSPLVARLRTGRTIEETYQMFKFNAAGQPIRPISIGHDVPAASLHITRNLVLPFHPWKHDVWYMLYLMLFADQHELLEIARSYDAFRDIFDTNGGEYFWKADFAEFAVRDPLQTVAQSRAIAWATNNQPLDERLRPVLMAYNSHAY